MSSTDDPDPPRRRLLRAPERAASILTAAATVFATRGYATTSLDDVAAAAGVSKLILYRHFGSKRELYLAILGQLGERLDAVESPPPPLDRDPAAAMAAAVTALGRAFAVARSMPDAYRLLLRHARREPEFAEYVRQVDDGSNERLGGMLAGIADPAVRTWLAGVVSATVDEAFLSWLDHGDPARDDEMIRRTALLLGSIVGTQLAYQPDK